MNTPEPSPGTPPSQLLESIYRHLPVMVVILGDNGIVSYCNPAAARVTGYSEQDLAGKNFWATLFPGRLFAQVPRFISAVHPAGLLASDVAMVIRTKEGQERVVAWSRITQEGLPGMEGKPALVCFGTDLTDRLNACDTEAAVDTMRKEGDSPLGVGNAGTVDGEIVTPLAISPPILPGDHAGNGGAIQQVHEFLTKIEEHVEALETAFSQGEMACLAGIADGLRSGAHACGLLDFSTRAQQLHTAAARGSLEQVSSLVNQIVNMVRPDRGK